MKKRIMQHCFGVSGSGGPVGAFERLLAKSTLSYGELRQVEPAGGVNVALIRRFIAEIKAYQPDLIHVRGLGNEGFHAVLAAKLAGVRNILLSIHGTHRDLTQHGNIVRHWVVAYILETFTLMMATHIATVCQFAASRKFLKPFQHKLVGVVSNGVEIPQKTMPDETNVRRRLGISETTPLAICVSRITTEKGYLVLADALSLLDGKTSPFAVVIVGGGDDDGQIKMHFNQLKHIQVIFVGHQKNVGSYLRNSDFFLFPSLHENLSNALIEAMSYQLPVIATDVGGNTEVVNQGGGILIPAGNAEKLASAIQLFLTDPDMVKRLGKEALTNIQHHYSIQHMVSGWESVYSKILGGLND